MTPSERAMLIRRGNELFNHKDYKNALKIYIAVEYKDGIARMASIMEHEKKDRITALKLYKKAGLHGNVEKLAYAMAQAIRLLIKEDKQEEATQKGVNFDTGYKVSGQAPSMLPHEAIAIAREKMGLAKNTLPTPYNKEITPWKPLTLSQKELDNLKDH